MRLFPDKNNFLVLLSLLYVYGSGYLTPKETHRFRVA